MLNSETGRRTELTELSRTLPGYSLLLSAAFLQWRKQSIRKAGPYVAGHRVLSGIYNRKTWVGLSVLLWLGSGLVNLAVHFPEAQRVKEWQIVFTVHFF